MPKFHDANSPFKRNGDHPVLVRVPCIGATGKESWHITVLAGSSVTLTRSLIYWPPHLSR